MALESNAQLRTLEEYRNIVVKMAGGNVVRLSEVATVEQSNRNSRAAAMFNAQPAILLIITKQSDANVIETVDHIRELIPEIKRWIPAGIDISVLSDRTGTIRASVAEASDSRNGGRPASKKYSVAAVEYTSVRASIGSQRICSGEA